MEENLIKSKNKNMTEGKVYFKVHPKSDAPLIRFVKGSRFAPEIVLPHLSQRLVFDTN